MKPPRNSWDAGADLLSSNSTAHCGPPPLALSASYKIDTYAGKTGECACGGCNALYPAGHIVSLVRKMRHSMMTTILFVLSLARCSHDACRRLGMRLCTGARLRASPLASVIGNNGARKLILGQNSWMGCRYTCMRAIPRYGKGICQCLPC